MLWIWRESRAGPAGRGSEERRERWGSEKRVRRMWAIAGAGPEDDKRLAVEVELKWGRSW